MRRSKNMESEKQGNKKKSLKNKEIEKRSSKNNEFDKKWVRKIKSTKSFPLLWPNFTRFTLKKIVKDLRFLIST